MDAGFKSHEAKLKTLLSELLQNKPDVKLDEEFVLNLRRKLLAKADLMQSQNASRFPLKAIAFSLSGLMVVVLAVLVGVYSRQIKTKQLPATQPYIFGGKSDKLLNASVNINKVSQQAFGKLSMADFSPVGRGGGGAGAGAAESFSSAAAAPTMSPDAKVAIMPPITTYSYVYKGGEIDLKDTELPVFKRVKGLGDNFDAKSLLKQLDFGSIDMDKFENTKIQSLNILQDMEYGYNFYINLEDGIINMSENWAKWPNPEKSCQDTQCYQNTRLKISDVPSDEELINIANRFLQDHNISLASYGQPAVADTWRQEYENMSDKSQAYIPAIYNIIYPLQVEGEDVYDPSGYKAGLAVGVDIRFKKVSGMADLASLKFESSDYPVITQSQEIIKYAERGGAANPNFYMQGSREVKLELGDPFKVYVKIMKNDGASSQELLVPALIFPIKNRPAGAAYAHKGIVVPLVKGILNDQATGGGPVRIYK